MSIKEPDNIIVCHLTDSPTPDFKFYYEDFRICQIDANAAKNHNYKRVPEWLWDEMLEEEHNHEKVFDMYYNYLMGWLRNERKKKSL